MAIAHQPLLYLIIWQIVAWMWVYCNFASIRTSKVVEKCGNKHSMCTTPMKRSITILCIALRWYHHENVDGFFLPQAQVLFLCSMEFHSSELQCLNYMCDYLEIMDRISIISAHIVNNIDCEMPFYLNFYWICGIQVYIWSLKERKREEGAAKTVR